MMDIKGVLLKWFINVLIKKLLVLILYTSTRSEPLRSETLTTHVLQNIFAGGTVMLNQELVKELHEPIIRKFKKRKVH